MKSDKILIIAAVIGIIIIAVETTFGLSSCEALGKDSAELEYPFEVLCPSCGAKMSPIPMANRVWPEFKEVFICITCGKYKADGVFYTRDEWDAWIEDRQGKRNEKIATLRIEKLKSYGWTDKRVKRILDGYIYIGDTPEIVREAWGEPEDINCTITAYGTREQWVYDLGCYVYFENGRVTAIQD